jgi:ferric-dicitrate binding protein FerR (iron transport regulator)
MRRHFRTIVPSLLALFMASTNVHAGSIEAALRYAEDNLGQAAQALARAQRQVEIMQGDLRIARDIESDALRLGDSAALAVAREAIAESERGLSEARQLLARANSLRAQRERTLEGLRTALRSGVPGGGVVVADGGDVRRYSADGMALEDVSGPLRAGETIRTGADGSARLFLGERGSQAQLAPESEFTVSEGETLRDFIGKLKQGLVRLLARLDRMERFEVRTPAAVCAVRGTDFAVENRDGQTRVRVFSGVVEVTASGDGKSIEVKAGQQWSSGTAVPEPFDPRAFPAPWESDPDAP